MKNQNRNVNRARTWTARMKRPATLSASRWIFGFAAWASSISFTIRARAVSFPTFVASNRSIPVLFIVAPIIWSPVFFSTGIDSPVIIDSSTAGEPSRTTPSTGIFSPGRTTTRSPTTTSSTGTSISLPPRTIRAVLAFSPMSLRIASEVPARDEEGDEQGGGLEERDLGASEARRREDRVHDPQDIRRPSPRRNEEVHVRVPVLEPPIRPDEELGPGTDHDGSGQRPQHVGAREPFRGERADRKEFPEPPEHDWGGENPRDRNEDRLLPNLFAPR